MGRGPPRTAPRVPPPPGRAPVGWRRLAISSKKAATRAEKPRSRRRAPPRPGRRAGLVVMTSLSARARSRQGLQQGPVQAGGPPGAAAHHRWQRSPGGGGPRRPPRRGQELPAAPGCRQAHLAGRENGARRQEGEKTTRANRPRARLVRPGAAFCSWTMSGTRGARRPGPGGSGVAAHRQDSFARWRRRSPGRPRSCGQGGQGLEPAQGALAGQGPGPQALGREAGPGEDPLLQGPAGAHHGDGEPWREPLELPRHRQAGEEVAAGAAAGYEHFAPHARVPPWAATESMIPTQAKLAKSEDPP